MTFPILPEEIKVEAGTRFQSYDIMSIGAVKLPRGEELTRFSWTCRFPGEKRQRKDSQGNFINPYLIVGHGDPIVIQEWFSKLRNKNIKCELTASGTPINHEVYLEKYTMTYSGGYGDYLCDISFIHAKALIVHTETVGDGQSQGPAKAQGRPPLEQPDSYTVKPGDSLWKISKRILGDENRFMEIAHLNNIPDPSFILSGQVIILPKA